MTEGIYQIRGLDLSNMTVVEGDRGVIVIDPLVSTETSGGTGSLSPASWRPAGHGRHLHPLAHRSFGGVAGVVTDEVPILAPEGFLQNAVSENVYAGTAMLRRGVYHTGSAVPVGPTGLIGTGLGQTASTGTVSLLPPTIDITHTGQEETVDGVRVVFQLTPNTEAPSEITTCAPMS